MLILPSHVISVPYEHHVTEIVESKVGCTEAHHGLATGVLISLEFSYYNVIYAYDYV